MRWGARKIAQPPLEIVSRLPLIAYTLTNGRSSVQKREDRLGGTISSSSCMLSRLYPLGSTAILPVLRSHSQSRYITLVPHMFRGGRDNTIKIRGSLYRFILMNLSLIRRPKTKNLQVTAVAVGVQVNLVILALPSLISFSFTCEINGDLYK